MKTTVNRLIKLVVLPLGFITLFCAFDTWVPLQPNGDVLLPSKLTPHTTAEVEHDSEEIINNSRFPASTRHSGIRLGKFSCVKSAFRGKVSNRYLAMHIVRLRDTAVANDKIVMKGLIRQLRDYGYCKPGYHRGRVSPEIDGWVRGDRRISDKRFLMIRWPSKKNKRAYRRAFGVNYSTAGQMHRSRYNKHWKKRKNIRRTSLASSRCGKGLSQHKRKRIRLCKRIARACGLVSRKQRRFCNDPEPREYHGGDGNSTGSTTGGTTGGSTTGGSTTGGSTTGGSTTGGSTTGNTGGPSGEVGTGGSNAGSGHSGNSAPGQGSGPPGQ